jgi:hypothetical protein
VARDLHFIGTVVAREGGGKEEEETVRGIQPVENINFRPELVACLILGEQRGRYGEKEHG